MGGLALVLCGVSRGKLLAKKGNEQPVPTLCRRASVGFASLPLITEP